MTFILTLLGLIQPEPTVAVVVIPEEAEVEAFYVPPGYTGVVVAIPADEVVF